MRLKRLFEVDRDDVDHWIYTQDEAIEILTEVINGTYSVEALRQDIKEYMDSLTGFVPDTRSEAKGER